MTKATTVMPMRDVTIGDTFVRISAQGMRHRPETTFGTVNADVLADKDPSFQPENFCRVIRASAWSG